MAELISKHIHIITEISIDQAINFFNDNHIQGFISSNIHLGLYIDNELCAATSYSYTELVQYAVKLNYAIPNSMQLLLNYYIQHHNPSKIIVYLDNRWNIVDAYTNCGFTYVENTAPKCYYFKNNDCTNLLSNFTNIEFNFDPNLTEWENMQLNGYNRIWDCGSSKWELTI